MVENRNGRGDWGRYFELSGKERVPRQIVTPVLLTQDHRNKNPGHSPLFLGDLCPEGTQSLPGPGCPRSVWRTSKPSGHGLESVWGYRRGTPRVKSSSRIENTLLHRHPFDRQVYGSEFSHGTLEGSIRPPVREPESRTQSFHPPEFDFPTKPN